MITKREVSDIVREDFWKSWWKRFSNEQVIHNERQIKSPDELEIGKTYQHIHINERTGQKTTKLFKIISLNVPKQRWFKAKYTDSEGNWKEVEGEFCMTYYGLVPYTNGKWDKFNYLLRVG